MINDYFEVIDTPVKAYIFGLLWADGCISQNRLSLGVKTSDIELLELVQRELGGSIKNRIRYDIRTNKSYTMSDWHLSSKYLVNQLKINGFRATPRVPECLRSPFLLGFFDGDGCIHLTKNGTVQLTFAGHITQDWSWFYESVQTIGNFVFTEYQNLDKRGYGGSSVRILGREALRLLDCLQVQDFGLSRKKEKYLEAKKRYLNKRKSSSSNRRNI